MQREFSEQSSGSAVKAGSKGASAARDQGQGRTQGRTQQQEQRQEQSGQQQQHFPPLPQQAPVMSQDVFVALLKRLGLMWDRLLKGDYDIESEGKNASDDSCCANCVIL